MTKTTANNKPRNSTNGAPASLFDVSETHHYFSLQEAHFQVARSLRGKHLNKSFLPDAIISANRDRAKSHALFQGKSDICVQRADWTSDHCHCHANTYMGTHTLHGQVDQNKTHQHVVIGLMT